VLQSGDDFAAESLLTDFALGNSSLAFLAASSLDFFLDYLEGMLLVGIGLEIISKMLVAFGALVQSVTPGAAAGCYGFTLNRSGAVSQIVVDIAGANSNFSCEHRDRQQRDDHYQSKKTSQ
jgi:hypothetical protein